MNKHKNIRLIYDKEGKLLSKTNVPFEPFLFNANLFYYDNIPYLLEKSVSLDRIVYTYKNLNKIKDVMDNDYKAFISETSGVITVKLSLPKEKETLASQFIDSLVTLVDKDIKNYFFPMLDMYETSVKQFIEQANSRKDNSTFAQNERLIYTIETSFRQNLKSFVHVYAE